MAAAFDSEGFQEVKRKRRKGKAKNIKINASVKGQDELHSECNEEKVISRIEDNRNELSASSFYASLTELFLKTAFTTDCLEDGVVLDVLDIVCYGLGCIRSCPIARYQFSLLLLLKKHFKISRSHCFVYDPLLKEQDKEIIQHFGCSVIDYNEEGKRKANKRCLFVMLHCGKPLYNNLLWANWGPQLCNVMILGNSFASYHSRLTEKQLAEQSVYIAKILAYVKEVEVSNTFRHNDIFNNTSLHYFPSQKLDKIPSKFWADHPEPEYEDDPEIITRNNKTEI